MNEAERPTTPPPLPEETGRQKSGSGGRFLLFGCLGTLVILALLALGAWHVYTNMVLPWFDETKKEIVKEAPSLEKFFEETSDLDIDETDLSKIATMKVPEKLTIEANKEGNVDSGNFPDDIYIPNGHAHSTFRVSTKEALAVLEFRDGKVEKMTTLYLDNMKKLGWKTEEAPKPEERVVLSFTKQQQTASVSIIPADEGLEVWLRISFQ